MSFAQFRIDAYMYKFLYVCIYTCTHTSVSNFSFPEESAYPPRKETRGLPCNRDSSPWSHPQRDAANKRTSSIEMERRYIRSDRPLLPRHSCEGIEDRLQIMRVICSSRRRKPIDKRISFAYTYIYLSLDKDNARNTYFFKLEYKKYKIM